MCTTDVAHGPKLVLGQEDSDLSDGALGGRSFGRADTGTGTARRTTPKGCFVTGLHADTDPQPCSRRVRVAMKSSPMAAVAAAEDRLNALLDEAHRAHEAVERLVERRPPALISQVDVGSIATPISRPPLQGLRPDVNGLSTPHPIPLAPGETALPAQLQALQLQVAELVAARQPASSAIQERDADERQTNATVQRLSSSARTSSISARLGRDLAASRAKMLELEHENAALRAVVDRHRSALREDATLRAELQEARRACAEMQAARAAEARQVDVLRSQLRDAEAETERLKVLLAGTVWFNAKA